MGKPSLAPPWVLFTDKGKPVAILPAGRPGEVANVEHLTRQEAQRIVKMANDFYSALDEIQMAYLWRELESIREEIDRNNARSRNDDPEGIRDLISNGTFPGPRRDA